MINGNFMITLIAMFAVLIAIFNGGLSEHITEHFTPITTIKNTTNPAFAPFSSTHQFMPVGGTAMSSGGVPICTAPTKLGYQTSRCGNSEFPTGMSTKRNMTTSVSPRFDTTGDTPYTPYMRTSGTAANNPNNPIDIFQAPSKPNTMSNEKFTYENAQVPLPQDMCNINIMGSESQPVIYDRLMYSNMRSRLRGQGDYIRGDLKITPDNYKSGCGNNWFQVSVKPERDLNPGAMEQLFGRSEELNLSVAQGDLSVPTFGI